MPLYWQPLISKRSSAVQLSGSSRMKFAFAPGRKSQNRVGRSVYWAMTELCKDRDDSFTPGEDAVAAVREGRYLVQPRPETWNRPEPSDE